MCGIFGYTKSNIDTKMDPNLLRDCTDTLFHRGPDDIAIYKDDLCGMGMRRLSILDLTPGLYPFQSTDQRYSCIFNGEIYNYKLLKKSLQSFGYKFRTDCDGEIIAYGYEKWGNNLFKKLQGMFAIAIWDKKEKTLILARDRIGIKPLYYYKSSTTFYFSSEIKSILNLKKYNESFSLDKENLNKLLGFMFLPDSRETIISGINKVSPGTYVEIKGNSHEENTYWDLDDIKPISISYQDASEQLERLLIDTIQNHLISDVPVGILLSGGLDSSLLTAMIAKNKMLGSIDTYTASFDHKYNEGDDGAYVAEYLGVNHHNVKIDTHDVNKNIENLINSYDDLTTFDGGLITTKKLTDEIHKTGVKVLLVGEGADEILGGYSWFGLSKYPFRLLPNSIRNQLYYYAISRNITYKPFYYNQIMDNCFSPTDSIFNQICLFEMSCQLPNHLLMKVDKATMASSIEARVPYLDHKIVEFIYSLPDDYKLKGKFYNPNKSNEKSILRDIAKKYLPKRTYSKKKKGFLLPMEDVLYSDINKVKDYVLSANAVSSRIFSKKFRENLFNKSLSKHMNMQKEYFTWRLFLLEVWAKQNQIM